MPADGHFGKAVPGPIQVVHRDTAKIAGYGAAGILAALGFLALLALLVIRLRRLRAGHAAAITASPDDGYTVP
jgi:hypothetical protein